MSYGAEQEDLSALRSGPEVVTISADHRLRKASRARCVHGYKYISLRPMQAHYCRRRLCTPDERRSSDEGLI